MDHDGVWWETMAKSNNRIQCKRFDFKCLFGIILLAPAFSFYVQLFKTLLFLHFLKVQEYFSTLPANSFQQKAK